MTGFKVRRLWPLLAAPLLLGGCAAAPYPPGGWPDLANAPYFLPPPGQFVPRPEPYRGRLPPPIDFSAVPPRDWSESTPPAYRGPEPAPAAPEPKPADPAKPPAPPIKDPYAELDAPIPVDPSCGSWWRLNNLWCKS